MLNEHDVWCSHRLRSSCTVQLRHAYANGNEYDDRTGYMGSLPDKTFYPEQCKPGCFRLSSVVSAIAFAFAILTNNSSLAGFNAQNHYSLGWFDDKTFQVPLSDALNEISLSGASSTTSFVINVAAFVDYRFIKHENTETKEYILVHIGEDVFLQYNLARDYNRDVGDMTDKLVLVRGTEYGTELLAGLGVGDEAAIEVTTESLHEQSALKALVKVGGSYSSDQSPYSYAETNKEDVGNVLIVVIDLFHINKTTSNQHDLRTTACVKSPQTLTRNLRGNSVKSSL